jgi:hypothetical protein
MSATPLRISVASTSHRTICRAMTIHWGSAAASTAASKPAISASATMPPTAPTTVNMRVNAFCLKKPRELLSS